MQIRRTYNIQLQKKNNEIKHVNDAPLISIETDTPEDIVVEQIEDILSPIIPNVKLQLDQTTMD